MKSRIGSIIAMAVAISVSGAACSSGGDAGEDTTEGEGPLRVSAYGSSWTDAVKATAAKKFTDATGVEVVFLEGNPSDIAAQIYATSAQGAEPPVDVITTDDPTQTQLASRELLVPVDEYKDEVPGLFGNIPAPPINVGYAPPHCDAYITFTYNKDKFDELGLSTPTSWEDLYAPELAGRVAIPDISTSMGIPTVFAMSNQEGLSAGIDRLAELDTYSVYSSSSEMQSDMANGNVWAAATIDGRAWELMESEPSIRAVHVNVPGTDKIGPRNGGCYLDVVKDSPRVSLAAQFIAAQYDDRVQVDFAGPTGSIPSSPTAIETLIDEEPVWRDRIPEFDDSIGLDWPDVVPRIPEITDEYNRKIN